MAEIGRASIFGKLNPLTYNAVHSAYLACKTSGHPQVELSHWVHQLLLLQDSDLHHIIRHFEIDATQLASDLTRCLETLPRGNPQPDFSPQLESAVERAWLDATLLFGEAQVRSGYLIVGILRKRELRNALYRISSQFEKIKLEALTDGFDTITARSPEVHLTAKDGFSLGSDSTAASAGLAPAGSPDVLAQFTTDLTQQARDGEIDPIVGRDEEIRQIVDILMRRRQNNPMITGEAGVGKTAVVEGFAQRIARGDVPPPLQNVTLLSLDIGLLQAGASMKGEFEGRLRQVIESVHASEKPIILFIDEAHTLIGAGGAAGTGDAANLLKPELARGTLRTIAATTWAEYKKHIEKDPALTRRFQVIQVEEPSEEKATLMMRGVSSVMEKHHQVQVLDEALEAAVKLSHRYIPARQLPDKSVSLLDTAAARVAISQHAVPGPIDDFRKTIDGLNTELSIIEKEANMGLNIGKRRDQALNKLDQVQTELSTLEEQWKQEKEKVKIIIELRSQLREQGFAVDKHTELETEQSANESLADTSTDQESQSANDDENTQEADTQTAPSLTAEEQQALRATLHSTQTELETIQGESPLIFPTVDHQIVASVVQDWTGIPIGRMVQNEIKTVLELPQLLGQRIIGQDHALEMISKRILTSRANMDNPKKPVGVFMLAGSSGVGKTETALALAETLYGGEQNLITINMSEFQEAHTVSTLKGAPPGYVGYGEGGVLTEAVRRCPYSVVLLDEIEKAHPDVHELFFQIFDRGFMEDGEGRLIDFKNTLILATTNVGTDLIMGMCQDPELMPSPEGIAKALKEPMLKIFPAALLGRMVTIPYFPLTDDVLALITRLQLKRIQKRIEEYHNIPLNYDEEVIKLIIARCTERESGGRMIDSILTNTILPKVSRELLTKIMEGHPINGVNINVEKDEFQYSFETDGGV